MQRNTKDFLRHQQKILINLAVLPVKWTATSCATSVESPDPSFDKILVGGKKPETKAVLLLFLSSKLL